MTAQQKILLMASLFGLLAVGLGAFGAHALKATLTANNRLDTYELAVRYHFYHTLALLAIAILIERFPGMNAAAYCLAAGIVLFSGSLYVMAIFNTTKVALVTPVGGLFFMAGWTLMLYAALRKGA